MKALLKQIADFGKTLDMPKAKKEAKSFILEVGSDTLTPLKAAT